MSRKTLVERIRIPLSRLFAALIVALLLFTDSRLDPEPISDLFIIFGLMLVGIAVVGRLTCAIYIGGHKTTQLVTDGPYAWSRNPLYFFSFLGTLGFGLITETFSIPLLLALFFALYYTPVILSEERRLAAAHGVAFENYFSSVPRFFPRPPAKTSVSSVEIKPSVFRKHAGSAIWFVWGAAMVLFIDMIRDMGWLPTLFYLN